MVGLKGAFMNSKDFNFIEKVLDKKVKEAGKDEIPHVVYERGGKDFPKACNWFNELFYQEKIMRLRREAKDGTIRLLYSYPERNAVIDVLCTEKTYLKIVIF
jgi:hypothetical protein